MWPTSPSNGHPPEASPSYANDRLRSEFDAVYEQARRAAEEQEREQASASRQRNSIMFPPRSRATSMSSAPTARRQGSSSRLSLGNAPQDLYGGSEDVDTHSIKMAGSRPPSRSSRRYSRPGGHIRGDSVYSTVSQAPGAGYLFLDHSIAEASADDSPRLMNSPRRGKGVMQARTRIPSAQGLLDEQYQAASGLPVQSSDDEAQREERTAALSPEEAWYTLRALVGEEMRLEQGALWRLKDLDGRDEMFGRDEEDDSEDDEELDARELPILRYLLRHFLLTLPLIRDTVPSDSTSMDNDAPAFWTEGVHPIIRAVHDADLSHPEDIGRPSLTSQVVGTHLFNAVERFVTAGLKLSSTVLQPESTGEITSPHLGPSTGGFNFQPHLTPPALHDPVSSPDRSATTSASETESPKPNPRRFSFGNLFRSNSPAQRPTEPSSRSGLQSVSQLGASRTTLVSPGPPPVMAPARLDSSADLTSQQNGVDLNNTSSSGATASTQKPFPQPPATTRQPGLVRSTSQATGFTSGLEETASLVSARESSDLHTADESVNDDDATRRLPHNPQYTLRGAEDVDDSSSARPFHVDHGDGATPVQEKSNPMDFQPYTVDGDDGDTTLQLNRHSTLPRSDSNAAHRSSHVDEVPASRRVPQQQDFVAAMAIPESAYASRPVTSAPLAVELVPKGGSPWPFGTPVPFWRGVPVERLKWGGFEADVVGVRNNLFSHSFIIRVRRPARLDEYVVRSEAQFKKYFTTLDKLYPEAHIRQIPSGDLKEDQIIKPRPSSLTHPSSTSVTTTRPVASRVNSSTSQVRSQTSQSRLAAGLRDAANDRNPSNSPHSSNRNSFSSQFAKTLRAQSINGDASSKLVRGRRNTLSGPARPYSSMSNRSAGSLPSNLALPLDFKKLPPHDPRRRALRAWLRDTLSIRTVGHHKETAAFLLLGSIVPRDSDVADIYKREAIDAARQSARVSVAQNVGQKARTTRALWAQVEAECIEGDGVQDISVALKNVATIDKLPARYFKCIESLRYSFAQSLYNLLVGDESSGAIFSKLKALHAAFPYFLVRQAFKVGRSRTMAKYLQDILLARPFGSKSLLQKILAIALDDDPRALLQQVGRLRARIGSIAMCEKLDAFAYESRHKKDVIRQYARDNDVELVLCIIRGSDEPRLPGYELDRIARASKKHKSFMKSKPSEAAKLQCDDTDVRLVLDLQAYLRLISRDRDSNLIRSLLGEDDIAHALEVIAGPFVELLKRIYKVGNASQALGQLKIFLDQLIIIIEALRTRIQEPQKSVRIIARLLARHQQALYDFVRNVHRGDQIVEEFLQWAWTASVFLRRGLAEPVDLDAVLPEEVEEKAYLFDEIEELVDYHRKKTAKRYQNLCRRYAGDVDADDPVIVEGDGHGKSKTEPHREPMPRQPLLQEIPSLVDAFRDQLKRVFAV